MSAEILNVDFKTGQVVSRELSAAMAILTDQRPNPELIAEFLRSFEVPANGASVSLYATLIREEAKEVREAAAHLLKELTDLEYVLEAHRQVGGVTLDGGRIIGEELDGDTLFALLDAYDPDVERVAQLRVHYSNMSKLGDDGKPVRRATDNKVLKGPNYKPCQLEDLLR